MSEAAITGRVVHRGAPLAGCQMLAIDEAARDVVADTETGADGRWELAAPGASLVVARCRGEALGVLARPAAEAGELELAPTHKLTVRCEADGMPEWATPEVLLTPIRIEGLGESRMRWISSSGPFFKTTPEDGVLARFVQAGTWWLSARFERVADARAEGMADVRWHATSARTADGRELEPLKRGFALEVDGPVDVTIMLAQTGR